MAFSCAGFLGVSCVAALTERFGAITSAITSTVRKGLTLFLSYVFYPDDKKITFWHLFGGSIFMWALFVRSLGKGKVKKSENSELGIDGKESDADADDEDYYDDLERVDISDLSPMLPLKRSSSISASKNEGGIQSV